MESIDCIIRAARERGCSDIHLTSGQPVSYRRIGRLEPDGPAVGPEETDVLIRSMLGPRQTERIEAGEDVDFSHTLPDGRRQRVNVYRERGRLAAAIRLLNDAVPTLEELSLPPILGRLALLSRGLILVTGPTGSGKSTTLAAMLRYINENRAVHILTIEDPIEYVHRNRRALIHQREVGEDASSFAGALRSALREDPDVILVGEMRDYETISAALTAAETGHLVLSTLHTIGAASTIDRIIDVFPAEGQHQVRAQLSAALQGVVTQQLIPTLDGTGRIAALEILTGNDAVRNLIRENKGHQIASLMQTGSKEGMRTLAQDLARLTLEGRIAAESAYAVCPGPDDLRQYLEAGVPGRF